jgi:hypothetical protein
METLTIEIPVKDSKIVKAILKTFDVKIINSKLSEKPNELTIKTIADAHKGKGKEGTIKNIRSFINSIN